MTRCAQASLASSHVASLTTFGTTSQSQSLSTTSAVVDMTTTTILSMPLATSTLMSSIDMCATLVYILTDIDTFHIDVWFRCHVMSACRIRHVLGASLVLHKCVSQRIALVSSQHRSISQSNATCGAGTACAMLRRTSPSNLLAVRWRVRMCIATSLVVGLHCSADCGPSSSHCIVGRTGVYLSSKEESNAK
jgi:hypothetical protein